SMSVESFAASMAKGRAEAIKKKLGVGPLTAGEETGGKSQATIAKIAGEESAGIQQTFVLEMLGQKVPHQASYFMLHTGGLKLMITAQVATRHLEATRPGGNRSLIRWLSMGDDG